MKEIIYRVGPKESIGLVPSPSKVKAGLLYKSCDDNKCLVYFPPNIKYWDEEDQKWRTDRGCGAISFAEETENGEYKQFNGKMDDYYINLDTKALKCIKNYHPEYE